MDYGDVDHRFARLRQEFVILAQATVPVEPTEGALHNPPMRESLEAGRLRRATDDWSFANWDREALSIRKRGSEYGQLR